MNLFRKKNKFEKVKKIKYKGFKIYFVAFTLFFLLISPMTSILYLTNLPKLHDINKLFGSNDSIKPETPIYDNGFIHVDAGNNGKIIDTIKVADKDFKVIKRHKKTDNNPVIFEFEGLLSKLIFLVFLLGLIYALPYKIYFRKKRKNKKIPKRIASFCKKNILYTPILNTVIVAIVFIGGELFLLNKIFIINDFANNLKRDIMLQYWLIFSVSALLTLTFVYYWQKFRVQIQYIDNIFTKEELKKRVFKQRSSKIKYRLLSTSFLTTLLPISIIITYIFQSLTSVKELALYAPNKTELKILFGDFGALLGDSTSKIINSPFNFYINMPNTLLMSFGITMGIIVAIIYLLFFVYWSNYEIVKPVNELLINMQKTTSGKLENYSIVRTNDEIGKLTENYNIMTESLFEYISRIDKMNAELEDKVKERTHEILLQKEEIEAQRDEVESQRDEIESQRDYVIEQKDIITLQQKSMTDSVKYARHIQNAILPPEELVNKIFNDYFIINKPKDIVSGDFYWLHQIPENKKQVLIAAADCTGHGVPGAFMSMLGTSALNEIVIENKIYKTNQILNNLRNSIIKTLHQTSKNVQTKDGIDLALCKIDFEKLHLEYSGAYNSIYIIRNNLEDKEIETLKKEETNIFKVFNYNNDVLIEIKADKMPIGTFKKENESFLVKKFDLKLGDKLYMFSDGFADQFGGKKGLKLLYRRFKKILHKYSNLPMNEQKDKINQEFENWKGEEEQLDDVILIGIAI